MFKIERDSVGSVVSVFDYDFFVEDYESPEALIQEIEKIYTLSSKEKKAISSLSFKKGYEENAIHE